MKRITRSPISVVVIALISLTTPAAAHSGHGNTLIHAVMHFFESNGAAAIALLLALFMAAATLISWLSQKKDRK